MKNFQNAIDNVSVLWYYIKALICVSAELNRYALVAQLDRVPGYEPVGRRFESCQAYQKNPYTVTVCEGFSFCHLKSINFDNGIDNSRLL